MIKHTIPPHMERVVAEKDQLDDRMVALYALLPDQPRIERLKIDKNELARLRRQYSYMRLYADVLVERLEASV